MQLYNAYHHFLTITAHRLCVMDLCFKVGLWRQGILHDLSKYTPEEFLTGIRYYQGNRSPNAMEKREKGYSAAWLHHKGRNKHHYEYWIDVDPARDFTFQGVKMPLDYCLEMVCDRIAACKIYNGKDYQDDAAWNYYVDRAEGMRMHEDTRALLEKLLKMMRDRGERETIAYMRWLRRHPERYGSAM